jgi:hypothetical protein
MSSSVSVAEKETCDVLQNLYKEVQGLFVSALYTNKLLIVVSDEMCCLFGMVKNI